jgi:hypothetical protein
MVPEASRPAFLLTHNLTEVGQQREQYHWLYPALMSLLYKLHLTNALLVCLALKMRSWTVLTTGFPFIIMY